MCIAYLAISAHPDWPLFIAANRDEFHHRPCLPAAPWPTHPGVIAGIDCQAQGSWLGITRQGRFALITNYRDPARIMANAPSRGGLVSEFLTGIEPTEVYANHVHTTGHTYNGFNLIVGDPGLACYVGNRAPQPGPARPVLHRAAIFFPTIYWTPPGPRRNDCAWHWMSFLWKNWTYR